MLVIENLKKTYGEIQALNDVSMTAEAGKVTAVLAKNGAGKSTLLSIIAGLFSADRGEVWIDRLSRSNARNRSRLQALVGFAAQESGVYPSLSVADNLNFFAKLYGIKDAERRQRLNQLYERFHLNDLRNRRCSQLSGGEKRRVHTAIALVHKPRLLLLDEPTLGADVFARNDILQAVKELAYEGTSVLYTSHYLHEIEALDANIVVMEKGRVLYQDSQENLQAEFGLNAIHIHFDSALADAAASQLQNAKVLTPSHISIEKSNQAINVGEIINKLPQFSSNIIQIERQQTSLEQLFHQVTETP